MATRYLNEAFNVDIGQQRRVSTEPLFIADLEYTHTIPDLDPLKTEQQHRFTVSSSLMQWLPSDSSGETCREAELQAKQVFVRDIYGDVLDRLYTLMYKTPAMPLHVRRQLHELACFIHRV